MKKLIPRDFLEGFIYTECWECLGRALCRCAACEVACAHHVSRVPDMYPCRLHRARGQVWGYPPPP